MGDVGILDATCSHKSHSIDGTYAMETRCMNCGWEGHMLLTCGHEFNSRAECPRCNVGGYAGPGMKKGEFVAIAGEE